MEKTIFISVDTPLTFLNLLIQEESVIRLKTPAYLCVLGLVNQKLGNKANAKEIVSVETHESFSGEDHEDFIKLTFAEKVARWGYPKFIGYEVTYLESEMIATKSDLEDAYINGEQWSQYTETNYPKSALPFASWFTKYFV
jgi:hypothetical protein